MAPRQRVNSALTLEDLLTELDIDTDDTDIDTNIDID